MIQQVLIKLPQYGRGIHLITDRIVEELPPLPQAGMLNLFIQHTSAGLTINENADPSVRDDLDKFFNQIAPEGKSYYTHTQEGPDDMPAHIKASLVGFSVQIPITNGRLNLGTWQGIYLCEFRNMGGNRKILATLIG
ncbi:MAG: secondary thiamine-phosphate synthase enzyme YjbQ [Bacteroidales bacterium]|nr:secondary thiamine-phosphate synthase enzyme YjbQ [Bacteroidales bacterium]MDD3892021.1 secondary thiamine-phosphate synthase enzyme YjbQ [Bacteroidales bacterium]